MSEPRIFMFSAKGHEVFSAAVRDAIERAPITLSGDGTEIKAAMDVDLSGLRNSLAALGPGHIVLCKPNEKDNANLR